MPSIFDLGGERELSDAELAPFFAETDTDTTLTFALDVLTGPMDPSEAAKIRSDLTRTAIFSNELPSDWRL